MIDPSTNAAIYATLALGALVLEFAPLIIAAVLIITILVWIFRR